MASKEHLVIEDENINSFTEQLDDASEDGYKVISSNAVYLRHNEGGRVRYENMYYALLAKTVEG